MRRKINLIQGRSLISSLVFAERIREAAPCEKDSLSQLGDPVS